MHFHSGYTSLADAYSPMDRDFYGSGAGTTEDISNIHGSYDSSVPNATDTSVKEIGMSVPMGIAAANAQGIASKIRMGVNSIEIGFPTQGSGQRGAHTPGMYGKDQRQAIKELGMANDVKFTTHAAYNVMGLTGMQGYGPNDMRAFDMNLARQGQQEIERAMDFAADVPGGGSVVVHTGEFLRPLTDMNLYDRNLSRGPDGRLMFKQRLTEEKDAKFYLIDDRTGQAMGQVERDKRVAFPVWNKYDPSNRDYWERGGGGRYRDANGNLVRPGDYIDYQGNLISDPFDPAKGRVPVYDRESGRFKVRYMDYENFAQEAEEKNRYLREKLGKEPDYYTKVTQTEAFLQATLETQEGHARGWAGQYAQRVGEELRAMDKLLEAREFYGKLDASLPESEKWKLLTRDPSLQRYLSPEIASPEQKSILEVINDQIRQLDRDIEFSRQASTSQEQQAYDTAENKYHIKEPLKYVERFTTRGYAEAAIHAMQRSRDPTNPIVMTLEHIFPERFGGHPEEHMWIVEKAREKMVELLTKPQVELGTSFADTPVFTKDPRTGMPELAKQPNPFYVDGMSEQKAKELAEKHIKITIDTGHLNLWRKYFQPAPGSTPEKNEEEFRGWYLDQIEKMAQKGMVGNVHLVDNFGYQDEHLAPGQGNAPVKEVMSILKKYGYDKAYTVEPGADASTDLSDFHGLMKAWRHFGSSIYGMGGGGMAGGGRGQTWGEVQHSYFGQNQPPYFVFGSYAPSNDWTLWSQTPME